MTALRLIQNFRHGRGLLWAGPDFNTETLERTLFKLGVSLVRVDGLDPAAVDPNRDVLFLDGDQPINPSTVLAVGSSLPVVPVIGIVGAEAPSRLKLLAEAGMTAFVRKPIHGAAVYSALFLGVNNFQRLRAQEARLAEHDRKRHGRRYVIKAVVALVQAHGLTDEEAYAQLRRESMRRRAGLEDFCESLFAEGCTQFPAGWPSFPAGSGPFSQQRENNDATTSTDKRRHAGHVGSDGGQGRGPDQARRA